MIVLRLPAAGGNFYDSRHQVRWEITIFKGIFNDVVPEIPKISRLRRAFIRKLSVFSGFPPFFLISKIFGPKIAYF